MAQQKKMTDVINAISQKYAGMQHGTLEAVASPW